MELKDNTSLLKKVNLNDYISKDIGLPTLKDIIKELEKPGLDPRGAASEFSFDERVKTINDLEVGMKLKGKITNVTNFGAFVNIGIKENGEPIVFEVNSMSLITREVAPKIVESFIKNPKY